ncbi:cytosine deaminase protein-like protein [Trichodelitschia bisporula]|uniref:Cytosine deaminase protein-like protein n=1 Tax=Trichodelitschia bisporula TaxID=703511 RepID=A0A6G1HXK6_9PEZI|nr:cytosine deaminase protein-like protein [Trichodelitschia bisporula]
MATESTSQEETIDISTDPEPGTQLTLISGARIPRKPLLWDIHLKDGVISSLTPHILRRLEPPKPTVLEAGGRLLTPSLCHAHIHLDKCFLLQDPKFSDLRPTRGDFAEALSLTQQAKSRFEPADLLRRGRVLIEESIRFGVTVMRAFVEVDAVVGLMCLQAGVALKKEFQNRCQVQLCAFAQDPLFSGPGADETRALMEAAAQMEEVEVVGSTPYVEVDGSTFSSDDGSFKNVKWISELAVQHGKQLDLHLDYTIVSTKKPFIWTALDILNVFPTVSPLRNITLGHCTRLASFSASEWDRVRSEIRKLPVSFVGLPTSDLFMMHSPSGARGTLPIPEMIRSHGLNCALAVNNVGNAFTPWGSCDPLGVASLGVGLFGAGTAQDAELLFECVSSRAKEAIGCAVTTMELGVGEPADFVLFGKEEPNWRSRKRVVEVIADPGTARTTVKGGVVTSAAA